jgi:type I restriction enzyme M protein
MKKHQKAAILHYVEASDPTGAIVKLAPTADLESGNIYFGPGITQHRVETDLKPEKWVEAYLVTRLVRELGYPATSIELQKEYPAGHPKTTKPRMDIVVRDDRELPLKTFMVIEAKEPDEFESQKTGIEGQLFGLGDHERPKGLKYMVYYTVDFLEERLQDKAIVIDAQRFSTFEAWDNEGRPSLDQLPTGYATATKSVYVNKRLEDLGSGEKALDTRLTRNEFLALRSDLHNVLWGGGGTPDNDIFSTLVKLFLTKIYDEEFTAEGQAYGFQIVFKDGEPQPASEVVSKLNSRSKLPDGQYEGLFRRAQKAYLELSDADVEAGQGLDTEKVSPGKIAYVVEELQGISLTQNENKDNSDILGEFFEYIVRAGFKQSKGQFFTHPNIVKFCVYALKLDTLVEHKIRDESTLPFIVDPACGSGTFLIEAMKAVTRCVIGRNLSSQVHKHAQQLIASWFPPLKDNIWAKDFIYGAEISTDLALATKVNMVLHGDGNINVLSKDGLLDFQRYEISAKVSALAKKSTKVGFPYRYPVNEQFDVLLSNPPFSVDLDTQTKRGLASRFQFADRRNSENLFIERWYQLLKPGGRMAVVLPEAVFDTGDNEYIRLFLFKHFSLKAVVSLPELAFKPWTPTRTSLLFAVKKTDKQVEEYDSAWRKKEKDFRALARAAPIAYVLQGNKLVDLASRMGSRYGVRLPLTASPVETVRSLKPFIAALKKRQDFDAKHPARADRYIADVEAWSTTDPNTQWPAEQSMKDVKRLLRTFFDERYEGKPVRDVLERHWEEIVQAAGGNWWVFGEVAHDFDQEILYFEVEHIGYKRTANRERVAPNQLFAVQNGEIDLTDSSKVLGQLRAQLGYGP